MSNGDKNEERNPRGHLEHACSPMLNTTDIQYANRLVVLGFICVPRHSSDKAYSSDGTHATNETAVTRRYTTYHRTDGGPNIKSIHNLSSHRWRTQERMRVGPPGFDPTCTQSGRPRNSCRPRTLLVFGYVRKLRPYPDNRRSSLELISLDDSCDRCGASRGAANLHSDV